MEDKYIIDANVFITAHRQRYLISVENLVLDILICYNSWGKLALGYSGQTVRHLISKVPDCLFSL